MNPKILIIGSTGKLGTKLCDYCFRNNIKIDAISCFKNTKKLIFLKKKNNIKYTYELSNNKQRNDFLLFIKKKKFNLIYFLDYGSSSLEYAKILLNNNSNSLFAIANKEMIISGGRFFINKIIKTNNKLIPLDSEHYSLFNTITSKAFIEKIYITASGGPFYYDKSINLEKVNFKQVISHPKWKMGINNSIDSSNFINKLLEMYELSIIYNVSIDKIDFLVSKEAFVHSIIHFNDGSITLNCFDNDMLITLVRPLNYFYKFKKSKLSKSIFNPIKFSLEEFNDKRFKLTKYLPFLKTLSHNNQINLILLNNIAHKLYLNNKLKYVDIFDFIYSNLKKDFNVANLNSFEKILSYIRNKEKAYENVI